MLNKLFKKMLSIALIFIITATPVFAKNSLKTTGEIAHEFNVMNMPEYIVIKTKEEINIKDIITIPQNAIISADVLEAQKERRWHKSGFIVCRLDKYLIEETGEEFDVSDKSIYFAVRKYEALDKQEAAILTGEIILTQAASIVGSCFIFFAPVDILYFFTKGAIQREKHPNWFKAGVSNAYDNSIFWFCLKGKPIDIEKNQLIKIKGLKQEKALKLRQQITKRKEKQSAKEEKRRIKQNIKKLKNSANSKQ